MPKVATTWAEHLRGKPGYVSNPNAKPVTTEPDVDPADVSEAELNEGIDDMHPKSLKKALEDLGIEPATGEGSTDANREKLREALTG